MNNIKRFIKNRKAISPIFATLILIAIAVIAGVVVYAFTSGYLSTMTSNTNAAQEKVSVQGVDVAGSQVYAQNLGSGTVSIISSVVKDTQGNIVNTKDLSTAVPLTGSTLMPVAFTAPSAGTYTVTLVSSAGGSFVSPSFTITS